MIKLTATDYYRANQPDYMRDHPDIMRALVRIQKNCKPRDCETCYFFHVIYDPDQFKTECSIGDVKYHYGRRAEGCPLDTGVFKFDEKLSQTADQENGGRTDERETGRETCGSEN